MDRKKLKERCVSTLEFAASFAGMALIARLIYTPVGAVITGVVVLAALAAEVRDKQGRTTFAEEQEKRNG